MEKLSFGQLQIAYEYQGKGTPIVLLHGALSDSRSWHQQISKFSGEFSVLAWDAPGCGKSSDPPETFRLADYADCLAALIEETGLERPHILGLSFGGGLALEFYRRYPDIPRSLILVSAYAGWAGSLPPDELEKRVRDVTHQLDLPPKQVVEKWLPTLFSDSVPAGVKEQTAAIMSEYHPAGMKVMLNAFARADLRDVLPEIDVPTLLIYGDADQRSPLSVARELNAGIPNSELVVLKGLGHVIHAEAPDRFNAEVLKFLKSYHE